ncbi:hypothetical protein Tco_1214077 [Tanacetum coccineum]
MGANGIDNATYSASADDIAVQSCFFDIQLTNLSPRNSIPPEVLLRVSIHPAWFASEKAVSSKPESFGYQSPMLMDRLQVVVLSALAWMDFHEHVLAGDLLSIALTFVGVVGSVEDGLFVVGGVSCCLELSVGEEDLLTLEVPALKNSSYKGPNRRSKSWLCLELLDPLKENIL